MKPYIILLLAFVLFSFKTFSQCAIPRTIYSEDSVFCINSILTYSTETGMTNYQWTVPPGATILNGGTPDDDHVTLQWTTPGTYNVSVNYSDANGCIAPSPASQSVTVNSVSLPIAGNSISCLGSTEVYSVDVGMLSYNWHVTSGTITSGQNTNSISITWNTIGVRTITVSYHDVNGCSNTSSKTVRVTSPVISGGVNAVCQNTSSTYYTESGNSNYQWLVSPGGTITNGGTSNSSFVTVNWVEPGNNWVSLNYINSGGCAATSPTIFNVQVNPVPTTPTINGDITPCLTTPLLSEGVYTTEPGQSNYQWAITGGYITSGESSNSVTVTWRGDPFSEPKTLSVNYANAYGCSAPSPASLDITVPPRVIPTITGNKIVCKNTTHTYTTQPGKTNYLWSVPVGGVITGGGTSSDNWITINWTQSPISDRLKISYTDENGCLGTSDYTQGTISVSNPDITMIGSETVCSGQPYYYGAEQGRSNYIWGVSSGGTIVSGGTANDHFAYVRWDIEGPQTISVSATTSAGCAPAAPMIKNIIVGPSNTPTITGTFSLCLGTQATYKTEPGKNTYNWVVTGGNITGFANDSIVTVSWNTPGVGTIGVYSFSESCQSTGQASKNVTINSITQPTISGNTSVCVGTAYSYTTAPGMSNYLWDVVSTGATITSGGTPSDNFINIVWGAEGNGHNVYVSYQDMNGCSSHSNVIGIDANALPIPTIWGTPLACTGSSVYSTEEAKANYEWTISPGGIIVSGASTNSVMVNWSLPGDYTVGVRYTDVNSCRNDQPTIKNVQVKTPSLSNNKGCLGSSTTYYTESNRLNYVWSVSGGGTIQDGGSTTDNFVKVFWNTAGQQSISVNYTTADCTPATPTIHAINITAPPVPTISGRDTLCLNTTETYTTEPGMTNYGWALKGGTIMGGGSTNDHTITILWTTSGDHYVHVTYSNTNGCAGTTQKSIRVKSIANMALLGNTVACQGANTRYSTNDFPAGQYTWVVSPDGATTAAGRILNVTWNTTGPKTVSVSYSSEYYCPAEQPTVLNVEVVPAPAPTVSGNVTVCQFDSGVTYSTEPGMSNYSWEIEGGNITSGMGTNQIAVTWNESGNQIIRVNYADVNNCSAITPTVKSVMVNEVPSPTISGNSITCLNSSENVYTTEPGKTNYSWTIPTGGTITAGGTSADNIVTVAWDASSGTKIIRVNYANEFGCRATFPSLKAISFYPQTVPAIDKSYGCLSSDNVYATAPGQSDYTWSVAGGTVNSGGTVNDNTISVTWETTGPKTVSVNYTDANGCRGGSPTVKSFIVNAQPLPSLSGNASARPCDVTNYSTESSMNNYEWRFNNGPIVAFFSASSSIPRQWTAEGIQTVSVSYADANGCRSQTAYKTVDIKKQSQSITFNPLTIPYYEDDDGFSPATSTSGLPVNYTSSNLQVAYISNGKIIVSGIGTTTITASQLGNDCYSAAPQVAQTVTVTKGIQNIVFESIPIKTYGAGPYTLSAYVSNGSDAPITFTSSNTSVATVSGHVLTFVGAGTSVITATKLGDNYYETATSQQILTVKKKEQQITFDLIGPQLVGNVFNVTAASSSGLPVVFSSSNPSVATISGNVITAIGAGTSVITARQPGDSDYEPALPFTQTLTVSKINQIIFFDMVNTSAVGDSFTVSATATSGLPVSITSSNASIASVSGSTITALAPGTVTIKASQPGNTQYDAATNVFHTLTIAPFTVQITGSNKYCQGGSALLVPSLYDDPGFSFQWSDGTTEYAKWVTIPGSYSLSVTKLATGVTATSNTITVSEMPIENGGGVSVGPYSCFSHAGQTLTLTANPSGTQYLWSTGETSPSISIQNYGVYAVTITSGSVVRKGCIDVPACFVRQRTGSAPEGSESHGDENPTLAFECFPNPTDKELTLQLPTPPTRPTRFQIYDQIGQIIHEASFDKDEVMKIIDTSNFKAGLYLIQITSNQGIMRKKIIVSHKN